MMPTEVRGLPDLLSRMKALPKELISKNGGPAKLAMRKAANLIRDEARQRAPVRTGLLQKSIIAYRDKKLPQGVGERFLVGVKGGGKAKYAKTKKNVRAGRSGKTYEKPSNAFYWRFFEFGTSKFPPAPFLRPAFETKKEQALNTIVSELDAGITRIVKKLGGT